MRFGRPLSLLILALPGTAAAAPVTPFGGLDAARTTTATAERPVDRDCAAGLASGRTGVATLPWRATSEGVLTTRLLGTREDGNWDLAAYDDRGRLLAGSAAFQANEVVQITMRPGTRITLQACRRAGAGATVPLRTQFARLDLDAIRRVGTQKTQLLRVTVPSGAAFARLEATGLDVTEDSGAGYANVITYGPQDVTTLRRLGLPFRVQMSDMVGYMRRMRARDARSARAGGRSPLPTGREEYRTYEDYQRELQEMVRDYPDLVQPVTLKTKSFQGRDIQVVEIAENVRNGDDGRPVFFLGSIHHAREWPAAESTMEFAWDLLRNRDTNPKFAEILRDVRVVLMPITNPDGFVSSRTAMDPDGGALTGAFPFGGNFAYRRKNCNSLIVPSGDVPCEAAIGVDNNRNYATDWGGPGASTTPTDQSYRGPGPNSEPETQAVIEINSALNAPVHLSVHNVAAKVLRPPGLEADGFAPDEAALKELGALMARPTNYANEYGWQLYDTTGTTKDWGYDALGQYSYTVEVGPAGGDFQGTYKTHVIDQYDGTIVNKRKLGGLREAYTNAALYTRNEAQTSRLTGTAPAGATLRVQKDFDSETYPVCTVANPQPLNVTTPLDYCTVPLEVQEVPEHVEITMQVPESGQFTWWLNPSTRPFSKTPEAYTLTCEIGGQVVKSQPVVVARGQTLALDPCA